MVVSFLFPGSMPRNYSFFLFILRILFGALLMMHGVGKLLDFQELAPVFPDPLGIGSKWSLVLAIFAEMFCSIGFILGFLYRLCLIPMLISMFTAFFYVHQGNVFGGESAFIYLIVFLLMFITGPGKYSVDNVIAGQLYRGKTAQKNPA